jgi:UPF0755 protein
MRPGHLVRLALLAVLCVGLVVVVASAWAWTALHRPYVGWEGEAAEVVIEPGLGAGAVVRRLTRAGVMRHPRLARGWLAWRGSAGRLQAGEYRFDRPASTVEVLDRLVSGDVALYPVTLPEGLSTIEIAERLEQAGIGSAHTFVALFSDPSLIADLDPEATDLEGYVFPETYQFPRGEAPERVVAAMIERFRETLGPEFVEEARESGLGLRKAVILASMIEKETSVPDERDRISRVFHNRLSRGMRLECDPTVIFALERAGREVSRLTYEDLKFDSPWNTYVVFGLPRGPIANPGRESLLAAVRPRDGDEIYFVAAPEGGHRFSTNLAAHLRAVAEWRRHVKSSR